jgi:hypothetical protein
VVGELSLPVVLRQIVGAARDLLGARYAALGVLGPDGGLEQFVHDGMDEELVARIGDLHTGRGILGLLISEPVPIRLADLTAHPASAGFPPGHPPMSGFLGIPVQGFRALTNKGIAVQPRPLRMIFTVVPRVFAVRYWQGQLRGTVGTVALAPHSKMTKDTELPVLYRDVQKLVGGTVPTPHLDKLLSLTPLLCLRSQQVGSANHIIHPGELRRYLVRAVRRGISRTLPRA